MTNAEQAYGRLREALKRGRVRIELSNTGLQFTMDCKRGFHSISMSIAWLHLELAKVDPLVEMEKTMERRLAARA